MRAFRFGVDCDVYTDRKALGPHHNAPLTWPAASWTTAGPCDGPPSASRPRRPRPSGGPTAIGSPGRQAWPIAPAPSAHQPAPDTYPHGAPDHQGPCPAPVGPSPHRGPAAAGALDRAPDDDPLRPGPPRTSGPGHRPGHPPLRTRTSRRTGHIDVKKLGRIPDGGSHKVLGREWAGPTRTVGAAPVTPTCTPPWTTTPASPTPKTCPTRRPPSAPASCGERSPGSPPRASLRTRPARQRLGLLQEHLARHLPRTGRQPSLDEALAAADQRQGRTLPSHPARRVGLHPALHLKCRTPGSVPRLAGLVQLPPTPHRHQRPTTSPRHQPVGTTHLTASLSLEPNRSLDRPFPSRCMS